jgi:hypothetical protein
MPMGGRLVQQVLMETCPGRACFKLALLVGFGRAARCQRKPQAGVEEETGDDRCWWHGLHQP